jgi:hypothetical protein
MWWARLDVQRDWLALPEGWDNASISRLRGFLCPDVPPLPQPGGRDIDLDDNPDLLVCGSLRDDVSHEAVKLYLLTGLEY